MLMPRAYAEVKAELDHRIAEASRILAEDEAVGVSSISPAWKANCASTGPKRPA
jgi:hypothetical protein